MCLGFESGKKFVGVTYKREQNHEEYNAMRRKDREVTKQSEIAQILDMCKTACIAMDDEGEPYAVPLSYGYEWKGDDLILYFHCAKEGKKLEILKRNNRVCFTIFSEGELLADTTAAHVLNDPELVKRANLKETSLYTLSMKCGIDDPQRFTEHFIRYENEKEHPER